MNYTSKEQSKKLIELGLNPDTADMFLSHHYLSDIGEGITSDWNIIQQRVSNQDVPCWSVGALLEILLKNFPDGGIMPNNNGSDNSGYWAYGDESGFGETRICTTIIEALYEFICWALEKSYIK